MLNSYFSKGPTVELRVFGRVFSYIQGLQWLSAVQKRDCDEPVLISKYHVSTDSGQATCSIGVFYLYL